MFLYKRHIYESKFRIGLTRNKIQSLCGTTQAGIPLKKDENNRIELKIVKRPISLKSVKNVALSKSYA